MDGRAHGIYSPVVRGGICSLVSLQVAAAQIVPAPLGIRPEKVGFPELEFALSILREPVVPARAGTHPLPRSAIPQTDPLPGGRKWPACAREEAPDWHEGYKEGSLFFIPNPAYVGSRAVLDSNLGMRAPRGHFSGLRLQYPLAAGRC
jgi:hypothetical protein